MDAGEHVMALYTPVFKDTSVADVIVHLGCKEVGNRKRWGNQQLALQYQFWTAEGSMSLTNPVQKEVVGFEMLFFVKGKLIHPCGDGCQFQPSRLSLPLSSNFQHVAEPLL